MYIFVNVIKGRQCFLQAALIAKFLLLINDKILVAY